MAVVAIPTERDELIKTVQVALTGSGIPIVLLRKKTFAKQIVEAIQTHSVNTGLMLTFPYKLPASVYELPVNGFYNVHPGPLPAYRGPSPVFHQIRNKEKNAGVTIHKVDNDFDTGPVVINEMIRLDPADTHGIVTEKLSYTAAKLIRTLLQLQSFDIAIPSRLRMSQRPYIIRSRKHEM